MKHLIFYSIAAVLMIIVGCNNKDDNMVISPDKKLSIDYQESDFHGRAMYWNDTFRFYSDGKWHESHENALYADYYCDKTDLKDYFITLQKEHHTEGDTGFKPIRIDQYTTSDGTPLYFVYAESYSEGTWHYYSYTALCVKNGKLWRYPVFLNDVGSDSIQSDILVLEPASIGFDFTSKPLHYDNDIDQKIIDYDIDNRIVLDSKNKTVIVAGIKLIQL